jgi:hypothetical protein
MNPTYQIAIKIRTPEGLADAGYFSLGTDLDFALSTFDSLKGEFNDTNDADIRICLIEKSAKAPSKQLKSIGCILNEFADNSKVIVRDIFKLLNLEK